MHYARMQLSDNMHIVLQIVIYINLNYHLLLWTVTIHPHIRGDIEICFDNLVRSSEQNVQSSASLESLDDQGVIPLP